MKEHRGVRWVLDLLPHKSRTAIATIDAYFNAYGHILPDGQLAGLDDAEAIVRSRYIERMPFCADDSDPRQPHRPCPEAHSCVTTPPHTEPRRVDPGSTLVSKRSGLG
jgi:hypothetical protein